MTVTPELLAGVRVDTPGQRLHAATPAGVIALEMYSQVKGDKERRADFFAALSPDVDPDAEANPIPTQTLPYTILPDGSRYEIVVRAPLEAVDAGWSEEQSRTVLPPYHILGGLSLQDFREMYPGVDVSGLSARDRYDVMVTERTRPTLAVAARVEGGEPLARIQTTGPDSIRYDEMLAGQFGESALRPDTAVAIIDSRLTMQKGDTGADRQKLEFVVHDGFQRVGAEAEAIAAWLRWLSRMLSWSKLLVLSLVRAHHCLMDPIEASTVLMLSSVGFRRQNRQNLVW